MADKSIKVPENAPGPWYVDTTCTPCRTCMEVAGADTLLKWNDAETYVYFHKQPDGDGELNTSDETIAVGPVF